MRKVMILVAAVLYGCSADNVQGRGADELGDASVSQASAPSGEVEMHFGSVTSASDIDKEELGERGGDITTLTTEGGKQYQLRWALGSVEEVNANLKERGFEVDRGDEDGFAARVGSDGGESCIAITGQNGVVLIHERPVADDEECESFDRIAGDLAYVVRVDVSEDDALNVAFGTVVGSYNGVTAYSNGTVSTVGPTSTYGIQYQCVEYVNRYSVVAKHKSNMKSTGNAKDYCSGRPTGYTVYTNPSATKPATGDIVVSAGGTYGHVAIVREVDSGSTFIKVIHQNWSNTSSDNSKTLTMSYGGGRYTVNSFSGSYPVKCWVR